MGDESEINDQLQKLKDAVLLLTDVMRSSTVAALGNTCNDILEESSAVYLFLEISAEEAILASNIDLFDRITAGINSFQTVKDKFNFWMGGATVEIDGVEVNGVTGLGVGGGANTGGAAPSADGAGRRPSVEVGMDIDERLMDRSMGEGGIVDAGEGSKKKVKKEKKTPKKDQKKEAATGVAADEGLGSDFAGGWPSWNVEGGEGNATWPGEVEHPRGASINEAWPPPVPTELRHNTAPPAVPGGDGFPDFFEEPGESAYVSKQQGNVPMDPVDFGFLPDCVVEQPYNSKEAGSRLRGTNATIRPSEVPAPIAAADAASSHRASGFGAFPTDMSTNNKAAATHMSPATVNNHNQRFPRSPKGRDGSFGMGEADRYPSLDSPAPWQSPKSLKSKSYEEGGAPGSVHLQMRLPNVTMDMITPDFHKNFQDHLAQALNISSARIRINSVKPVN